MKKHLFAIALFTLLVAAFGIRFFALGRVPVGMTDDELRETYSAQALWQGSTLPFLFVVDNFSFNPIPIYITAPIVGIFGVSMATARAPYAIAGFLAVLGTFLLVRRLTGNKWLALAAAFCMTFNVWAVQLSRIAYEAGFALLFYTWGTYVFLGVAKKHPVRSVAGAMVLFFLAFNSYDATKFLYVPLLILLCIFLSRHVNRRILYTIACFALATVLIFVGTYGVQPRVRGSQFTVFQNTGAADAAVISARSASSSPEFLKRIYHNRITYFSDVFFRHYLYTFSMEYLFFNQEASGIYSLWLRGSFYFLELPLLALGGLYIFLKQRRVFAFSVTAMAIAAISAGIGPEPFTYATRASFVLPWLSMFIGGGIVYLLELTKKYRVAVVLTILLLYVFSIVGYLNQYYFEWSKNNAVYFSKGVEGLVRYLAPRSDGKIIEIANMNNAFFLHWALITGRDPDTISNIVILPSCKATVADLAPDVVYAANPSCSKEKPSHVILLPDGTPQWAIYVRE